MVETQLDKLYKIIETVYEDLDRVKEMISKLQLEARKEALKDIPGVEGIFDGKHLITDTNEKVEVPANYAAKSRIVYGDRLKSYEDEGKQVFKQLEKVSRKKIEAVVSKKEGKFYALTENGSYELSATAVEFNKVNVNDKIQIIIPEDNPHAPYAALDKIIEQKNPTPISNSLQAPVIKSEVRKEPSKVESVIAPVVEENKEFVMDLSASNVSTDLPLVNTKTVEVTPVISVPVEKPVAKAPVVQMSINKPTNNTQASNSGNRNSRSSSNPNNRKRRSPSSSGSRPSSPRNQSNGQFQSRDNQRGSNSSTPRYPSRNDQSQSINNQPQNNAPQGTEFKPFILEDDDLR